MLTRYFFLSNSFCLLRLAGNKMLKEKLVPRNSKINAVDVIRNCVKRKTETIFFYEVKFSKKTHETFLNRMKHSGGILNHVISNIRTS